jgi:hypothetical protein
MSKAISNILNSFDEHTYSRHLGLIIAVFKKEKESCSRAIVKIISTTCDDEILI